MRKSDAILPSLIEMEFKKRQTPIEHRNLLIIGGNEKSAFIIDSLKKYMLDSGNTIHVTQRDALDELVIKEVADGKYGKAILLSTSDGQHTGDPDSLAIANLLRISKAAKQSHTSLIIELINPRNAQITSRYGIKYSILTNRYISRIISQTSKNPVFYPFIEDLFTYDDESLNEESYEIYIHKASELIVLNKGQTLTFESPSHLVRSFYEQNPQDPYIVIGIIKEDKDDHSKYEVIMFENDMDEKADIVIVPDTKLIIVAK